MKKKKRSTQLKVAGGVARLTVEAMSREFFVVIGHSPEGWSWSVDEPERSLLTTGVAATWAVAYRHALRSAERMSAGE